MIKAAAIHQHNAQNRTSGVQNAIHLASQKTGVDFTYLVRQAEVESGLNPTAKARTSSATGLYQFIEQTWLRTMKTYGAQHGYGEVANAITQRSDGRMVVADRGKRAEILAMRNDPKASSLMAAELAGENAAHLKSRTGKVASSTDLYMAHFLGAGGASNFINSMNKNPWAPAATIFPDAARANPNVFYKNGKPLSLSEVYARFEGKFEGGPAAPTPEVQVAKAERNHKPVRIAAAQTWEDPAVEIATRSSNSTINTLRSLYAPDVSDSRDMVTGSRRLPGGFLASPLTVMELADTSSSDNSRRNKRYNA